MRAVTLRSLAGLTVDIKRFLRQGGKFRLSLQVSRYNGGHVIYRAEMDRLPLLAHLFWGGVRGVANVEGSYRELMVHCSLGWGQRSVPMGPQLGGATLHSEKATWLRICAQFFFSS
jgi:hypothetical protein